MSIILEGPDNSGKSTLAHKLKIQIGLAVISSEGRERHPGEINDRIRRYNQGPPSVIYDRHPVISQTIYGQIVANTPVSNELVEQFYNSNHLIIYCRPPPNRGMIGHVIKDHDDPDYLGKIERDYHQLLIAYDAWALTHANYIYRLGEPIDNVVKLCRGAI